MKKFTRKVGLLAALILLCMAFSACGKTGNVKIDYGKSKIYSEADRESAVRVIEKDVRSWKGQCELYNLRYAGDDCNSAENVKWMNDLAEGQGVNEKFTECISFKGDYYADDGLSRDGRYDDWSWWLARSDGGKWYIMTQGYG